MTLTTRMLTLETWDDFAALVEANNGVWGGCWCIGFHPEGAGAGHSAEGNREIKRRHVTRGTVHQVLVYDGDRCVGWCQFGPPPELPNIKNRRAYDQAADDPPDWRIGCIFTNAKDRGKGVAAAAVAAALDQIRQAGGGVVEAYPEQTEERPPQRGAYLHTGPEELYTRHGFTRVRKIAKWRWVMRTTVQPPVNPRDTTP
jgi:GNAT superfamily N-acetyltransferase